MKKYLLFCSSTILFLSISFFLFLNIMIEKDINNNKKFFKIFHNIFSTVSLSIGDEYENHLPKLEIDGINYIGVINIADLSIPIKSNCNYSFVSTCIYDNSPLIILGTNLKNSFSSYKLSEINDMVMFTNTLGETFQYMITNIKRMNRLNDISPYNEDLMIIIKNYYSMEYILFICDLY